MINLYAFEEADRDWIIAIKRYDVEMKKAAYLESALEARLAYNLAQAELKVMTESTEDSYISDLANYIKEAAEENEEKTKGALANIWDAICKLFKSLWNAISSPFKNKEAVDKLKQDNRESVIPVDINSIIAEVEKVKAAVDSGDHKKIIAVAGAAVGAGAIATGINLINNKNGTNDGSFKGITVSAFTAAHEKLVNLVGSIESALEKLKAKFSKNQQPELAGPSRVDKDTRNSGSLSDEDALKQATSMQQQLAGASGEEKLKLEKRIGRMLSEHPDLIPKINGGENFVKKYKSASDKLQSDRAAEVEAYKQKQADKEARVKGGKQADSDGISFNQKYAEMKKNYANAKMQIDNDTLLNNVLKDQRKKDTKKKYNELVDELNTKAGTQYPHFEYSTEEILMGKFTVNVYTEQTEEGESISALEKFIGAIKALCNKFTAMFNIFNSGNEIVNSVKSIWGAISNAANTVKDKAQETASNIKNAVTGNKDDQQSSSVDRKKNASSQPS